MIDDDIVPTAEKAPNRPFSSPNSSHLLASTGAKVRPFVDKSSEVKLLLKDRKEDDEIVDIMMWMSLPVLMLFKNVLLSTKNVHQAVLVTLLHPLA